MKTFEKEAARGANFMDEKVPGWYEKIEPGKLCMEFSDCCILGQLYISYQRGVDALNLYEGDDDDEGITFGFRISSFFLWPLRIAEMNRRWKSLGDSWRREINRRKAIDRELSEMLKEVGSTLNRDDHAETRSS